MTLRSSATPTAPGEQKGDRHRDDEIGVDPRRRQKRAEELLHDKGGIGAEHDHLAMRHVDDAHHAEGDGEPDRGEQQDAAEADALEQIGGEADQPKPVVDRGERGVGGLAQLGIEIGARRGTASSRFLICGSVVVPSARDRGERCSAWCPQTSRAAERLCCHRRADLAGPSRRRAPFRAAPPPSAEGCRSASCAAREPGGGIGAEQGQLAERALDRAAQPVVDADPVERRPARRRRLGARSTGSSQLVAAADDQTTRPSGALTQPAVAAAPSGPATARASPSLPSATTACSFSAKLSPPRPATSVAKSSARAGKRRQRDQERSQQAPDRTPDRAAHSQCRSSQPSRRLGRAGPADASAGWHERRAVRSALVRAQSVYLGAVQLPQTQG